jgi:hypothetical protein
MSYLNEDFIRRTTLLALLEESNALPVKGMRLGKTLLVDYTNKIRDHYMDIIRNAPVADVQERHYGMWEDAGKTKSGTPIRRCSWCKIEKAGRPKSNYCPDCGCQMFDGDVLEGQMRFI